MERYLEVNNQKYLVEYPDKCPICHRHSEIPVMRTSVEPDRNGVQVVFQCAFSGCKSYFIGYYGPISSKELKALKPQRSEVTSIPETIHKLSPSFISIYQEADEASAHGLHQIAGPGYRKAFEFLIKDYAKSLKPNESERIENIFSGNVVNEFITDPRIQSVAKRALWLGNDETHYLKKWVAHDINDLKTLIRLAINWVEIEQLSNSYERNMPDKT
ncbi:hypothetical protein [Shewanella sp. 1180_01]|uniref:hypothetical protein n=1 Tax=Shewanella sp. 1180_01 TaxID=2604451 RepID=UPI0040638458